MLFRSSNEKLETPGDERFSKNEKVHSEDVIEKNNMKVEGRETREGQQNAEYSGRLRILGTRVEGFRVY